MYRHSVVGVGDFRLRDCRGPIPSAARRRGDGGPLQPDKGGLPIRVASRSSVRSGHTPPVPAGPLLCSGLSAKEELIISDTGRDGYRREGSVVGKRRIGPCPPHGPMMVAAVGRNAYVARCPRCGLSGPQRGDGVDAKRALRDATRGYHSGRRFVDQHPEYVQGGRTDGRRQAAPEVG
jgi:hypothetical protein